MVLFILADNREDVEAADDKYLLTELNNKAISNDL